ncbi:MAG: DUF2723 domain-containing protein, partial [Chloroflexi bacterium]|nr:DUF2723 domain-containing protein [Chloroflexota bacterium]
MKKLFQSRDAQIALGLSAAIFLLYLLTLAPDVVDGDGGEFQFAAWNFSFVHPTGYPLYLILGGVFQHLLAFVSTPAYWLNFFTALNAAGAVGFIYLIVRQVSASQRAAMLAAFSFGVSRMFWFDALAAEAYALHAFFVALLIWLALRWQNDPSTENLTWFALTFGFALTHHRSIILWIPAFALFFGMVWRKQRASTPSQTLAATRSARAVLRFAFYLLMPLLLYLYIPIRAPLAPYANFSISSNQQISLYDNTVTGF